MLWKENIPITEWLGRTGLVARALIYISIGIILAASLMGPRRTNDGANPSEAFRGIEGWPAGPWLLVALGICLSFYTLFRIIQAFTEEQDPSWSARLARMGMVSSGVSYGLVGYTAVSIAVGESAGDDQESTRALIQILLEQPYGRWLIGLVGVLLFGIAIIQGFRAVAERWKNRLDLTDTPEAWVRFSSFAIAGRAGLILVMAISVLWAGITADASESMGMTATLTWLRDQPMGAVLYALSAAVMLGYGVYGLIQAKTYQF